MIISHKHRFIFLHSPKTAGSSISHVLSRTLGPWDIQLSAISETLEGGRRIPLRMWLAGLTRSGPRLAIQVARAPSRYPKAFASAVKSAYASKLGFAPQHASAASIRSAFPTEWENYTKFSVIRNPFSRAVSLYNWRTRNCKTRPSFIEYLRALAIGDSLGGIVPLHLHDSWNHYTIEGHLALDRIIRYENLKEGFAAVMGSIGIPDEEELPQLKVSKSTDGRLENYTNYYCPDAVSIVSKLYEKEIDAFGYKYGE